jgi:hypothetical protein
MMNLTLSDVRNRVEAIRAMANDDEGAHAAEDRLHVDVLTALAEGARGGKLLAAEALKTRDIDFERWCA